MNVRAHAQRRARRPRPWKRRSIDWLFVQGFAERERLYIENVLRPQAQRVSARITAQLRADFTFRGEAYVKVGWDVDREAATYERVPPSSILRSISDSPLVGVGAIDAIPGAREMYRRLAQAEYDALVKGVLGE